MAGTNRDTFALMGGWGHVVQSIMVIFTTGYGERLLRMWFGSNVPMLLGESMTEQTVVRYFAAIIAAMEVIELNGLPREPRFKITKIRPIKVERLGALTVEITGIYMPRGHLGDFTPEDIRSLTLSPPARAA